MSLRSKARSAARIGVLSLITFMAGLSGPALAADASPKAEREFSAEAGEVVNNTVMLLQADDYKAALSALEQLLYNPDLNPYELSTIYQMIGSAHYELNDYTEAITAFERAMDSGGLLPEEAKGMAWNIAQLLLAVGEVANAIDRMDAYLRAYPEAFDTVSPLLLAALVRSENLERAAELTGQVLSKADVKKRRDFETLIFLYSAMGQQAQADFTRQEMEIVLAEQAKRTSRAAQ